MAKRTRTGCITCRIRRVKCDETKPECTRCTTTGRKCDGYLAEENFIPRRELLNAVQGVATVGPASTAIASTHRALAKSSRSRSSPSASRSPPHARLDSDLFDYFRRNTAPSTSSFLPSDFWDKEALQLALNEPAVWHAAAAVGALHRRWDLESQTSDWGADAQKLTQRAQFHHGKALSLVKDLHSSSKFLALAMMLMTSANLMGNVSGAQQHVLEALRSAAELRDNQKQPDHQVDSVAGILSRLDFQAMTFSDSASPYPYMKAIQFLRPDSPADIEMRQNITSYGQAATAMYPMFKRMMLVDEAFGYQTQCGEYLHHLGIFMRDIAEWESSMARFESKLAPEAWESTPGLSLRIWHTLLRMLVKATWVGHEVRWDTCLAHFERIVLLSEVVASRLCEPSQPRLTAEPGLILPLFFTAHRCRQPLLRRRAVALLQRLNSHEGMWRSDATATVVHALVNIEEGLWNDDDLRNTSPHFERLTPPASLNGAAWLEKLVSVPWESWSTQALPVLETPEYFTPMIAEKRVGDVFIVAQFPIRKLSLTFAMASSRPIDGYSDKKLFEFTF